MAGGAVRGAVEPQGDLQQRAVGMDSPSPEVTRTLAST